MCRCVQMCADVCGLLLHYLGRWRLLFDTSYAIAVLRQYEILPSLTTNVGGWVVHSPTHGILGRYRFLY